MVICFGTSACIGWSTPAPLRSRRPRASSAVPSKRLSSAGPLMQTDILSRSVGSDGGDIWSGARVTRDELKELAAAATSATVAEPVMAQFYTSRRWLWGQWKSTIVKAVLPREVLINSGLCALWALFFYCPGPHLSWRTALLQNLKGVNTVWLLASSLVTFTISFFLTQAYTVWRSVLSKSRRVQGRLNDLGLLCASCAARDAYGAYAPESRALLDTVARYTPK